MFDLTLPRPLIGQLLPVPSSHWSKLSNHMVTFVRPEEKRQLPTRVQWEIKKKEKEALEKWSGNMSVNDMLLLYSDDPAGYFGNPDRKPESDLYKQHAVEGLKHEFR